MSTFKNKLLKLFMTGMLVLTSFAFLSCGGNGAGGGSGGGADGSGGGDGTPQLTAAQKAKLKALNGYEITFEYNISDEAGTENGEYTLGEKGDVSWFSTEGMSMALKKTGSTIETYMGRPDEEDEDTIVWYNLGGEDQDFDISFAEGFFAWANDYDLSEFTSAGTDTVAGRSCNKYTCTDSAYGYGEWATASWTIWIDKELDITMKFEVSGSSSNQGSSEYYYRITSFKTGNEVTLPDLENAVDMSNM